MNFRALCIALLLCIHLPVLSDDTTLSIGDKVSVGDTAKTLVNKLQDYCTSIHSIINPSPSYPLASKDETHILCREYNKGDIQFSKAVFVVADNQFVQMEAQWIDAESLVNSLGERNTTYIEMDVYQGGEFWVNHASKTFIWLSKDALHPNLFAWHNPKLETTAAKEYDSTTRIPELFDFNATIDTLRPLFEQQCKFVQEDKIEKIWLPNNPTQQIQINCFGFEFAGFERKLEAVFGDGRLQVIWILSGKPEEARIHTQLISDWGEAENTNPKWDVFSGGKIALRKDKPEILVLSDTMIPFYRDDFSNTQNTH